MGKRAKRVKGLPDPSALRALAFTAPQRLCRCRARRKIAWNCGFHVLGNA